MSWMIALLLPSGSLRAAELTAERLDAILTFRAQHLQLREVTHVAPGSVTVVHSGWGRPLGPWRGWRWYDGHVIATEPPTFTHAWVVYQGPRSLSVPEYLGVVGHASDAQALQTRVDRAQRSGRVWSAVAVGGALGGIGTALVGLAVPDAPDAAAPIGFAIMAGGLVSIGIGGARHSRSRALALDYERTQELVQVQDDVQRWNEQLRVQLGLTPEEAYRQLTDPDRWRRRRSGG